MTTMQRNREIDADALLGIPEIREAYEAYVNIQREYQDELRHAITRSPRPELPDVSDLAERYGSRLENQRLVVVRLVEKHT